MLVIGSTEFLSQAVMDNPDFANRPVLIIDEKQTKQVLTSVKT